MAEGDVRQLFRFIDWMMDLPEPLDRLFWQEVTRCQEEKHMPFVTIAERVGREKGLREGFLAGIELALELKFGSEGLQLLPEIRAIEDVEMLRSIHQAIKTTASVEELRRIWAP
jgi:hypothetical protein